MQPDFYVDTHMSSEYSCRLLSSWSVEDAEFSPTFQQGKNATAFTALRGSVGLKTLTLPLHFFGKTAAEAVEQKSRFLALLLDGIHALQMPTAFYTVPRWKVSAKRKQSRRTARFCHVNLPYKASAAATCKRTPCPQAAAHFTLRAHTHPWTAALLCA